MQMQYGRAAAASSCQPVIFTSCVGHMLLHKQLQWRQTRGTNAQQLNIAEVPHQAAVRYVIGDGLSCVWLSGGRPVGLPSSHLAMSINAASTLGSLMRGPNEGLC
eukprot:GHUV01031376.1.p1 GENE.GHUV01031376.1~~GHUV01031376.1.p1  ORF type:complete len:105 (-),score=11.78 GHUV01031376.1:754-1068(-)